VHVEWAAMMIALLAAQADVRLVHATQEINE
jgi:hypothetical protein